MTDSAPIVVNASPAPDQWAAGARQLILILGPLAAFAAANHMLALADWLNLAVAIVGPCAALASLIVGQLHTRKAAQNQAAMAKALPNAVAQVKPT
jgi:hypothetical protein